MSSLTEHGRDIASAYDESAIEQEVARTPGSRTVSGILRSGPSFGTWLATAGSMTMRLCGSSVTGLAVLTLALSSACAAPPNPGLAPVAPAQQQPSPQQQPVQDPGDPLGRDTPRGTVMGFLDAAREAQDEIAPEFLDTQLTGQDAAALTHELFVVLDMRLPVQMRRLSDRPEGSRSNPLRPDRDVVGTIRSASGNVDVVVERLPRGSSGPIWLFSADTLAAVPALYEEVTLGWSDGMFPRFLTGNRVAGIRLFEWIVALLGLPFFYLLTILLNKLLTPLIRWLWNTFAGPSHLFDGGALPRPIRLLILALAIRWPLSSLPLPFLVRHFWSNLGSIFTIVGIVWLLILLNGKVEGHIRRHFPRGHLPAAVTLVRLLRRLADSVVVFTGLLVLLRHFGVDVTPALAGLGVGGIAVALAAQRTLENVIAGASLIFDQAVRVGDFLRMGDVIGTVDHIGLRSTRIRTLDRTIVIVPNSQIASVSLETLSERDKFWFNPAIGLRSETTPEQLRVVIDGIHRLLTEHPSVETASVRVRLMNLGPFSLDIDVFAYVAARDWNHFLEIREQLLFTVTEVVEAAGTGIAFRSMAIHQVNVQEASPRP